MTHTPLRFSTQVFNQSSNCLRAAPCRRTRPKALVNKPMRDQHHGRTANGQTKQRDAAQLVHFVDGVPDSVLRLHGRAFRSRAIAVGINDIVRRRKRMGAGMDDYGHEGFLFDREDNSPDPTEIVRQGAASSPVGVFQGPSQGPLGSRVSASAGCL